MKYDLLVIAGPTASGKTRLGVLLAERLGGEVVSADSMQLYRRMDIGTAKPTPEETRGIPHHMIDVAEPDEAFSAGRYLELAEPIVRDILARGKVPILVGGTGLYIDSLVDGRTFAVPATGVRERLKARVQAEGLPALREELRRIDPDAADRIGERDEKRTLRALEVWYETGRTITQHNLETKALPPRFRALKVVLCFEDRAEQNRRIDARVGEMMEAGLENEVRALMEEGVPMDATSMQAIGYKEMAAALRCGGNPGEAAEEIRLRSRQYAKRQLTWFRRDPENRWLRWTSAQPDFDDAAEQVLRWWRE